MTFLKNRTSTTVLILTLLLSLLWSCSKESKEIPTENPEEEIPIEKIDPWTGLQIVLFTPSDVELPSDCQDRMKETIDYTEWFFTKWMNHWGYNCENPLKIQRDEDGYPIIWRIKGKHSMAAGKYEDSWNYAQNEVIPEAISKYNISKDNQTWWIISYPGPSKKAYRGGGSFRGGKSVANFTPDTGTLILPGDDKLGTGAAADFKLKAVIHELTHALGIAHLGPLVKDSLGNSLMGPTNNAFHKINPDDDRVYLTKTSASILWKHPLFSGSYENINSTPSISLTDFHSSYNDDTKTIQVSGKLLSEIPAHSVIITNNSENDKSEYWRKSFVGDINDDGSFTCNVEELEPSSGHLIISFCFDNGAVSGVTGKFGVSNGIQKEYTYIDGNYQFN